MTKIDFGWFLPTMGDSEIIGPPTRQPTLDYLEKIVTTAEDAGFTFALVPVGGACQDSWLSAAAVAGRTRSLKFLVAMRPGFVAPTVAAKMSNTLDQLTHGRVLINIVTGGYPAELEADGDFLDHDKRYERTQEFMQVVRKAWAEEKRWDYEGNYYKVRGAKLFPAPFQQSCPPFYFGGASEAGKRVGAEESDVYLLWAETQEMVRERVEDMRARAAQLGRTLRFGMRIHVVVRETEEEAWAAAEELISDIPEQMESVMKKVHARTDSEGERRQQQMRTGNGDDNLVIGPNLWTGIGKARVGVGTALVGSGENVAKRLQEYADIGLDTFILSGYPHLEEAERFGMYVMPYFAGKKTEASAAA